MKIRGLTYLDGKITSYSFKLDKKNFLFDFGTDDLSNYEIEKLDYIIISHYHHDHCYGLLKYIDNLSEKCLIIATNTTFSLIFDLLEDYYGSVDKAEKVRKFILSHCYIAVFNEVLNRDGFIMKFYPSGHTFGSMMVLIKGTEKSLFFSSDMDYISSNNFRQYYVDEMIEADYAILDGTCLGEKDFKTSKTLSVKFDERNDLYLKYNPDKAVFAAFDLVKKYKDCYILYDRELYIFMYSLSLSGYDVFNHDDERIMTKTKYDNYVDSGVIVKKPCIIMSTERKYFKGLKRNNFEPNNLFSLHIVDKDRDEFVLNFLSKKCKVLLGHYNVDYDEDYLNNYCSPRGYDYIRRGEYYYGEK